MIGTFINFLAILVGGMLGLATGRRFSRTISETVTWILGIITIVVGLQMALETKNILILVVSLVAGAILGESLRIESGLEGLAKRLEMKIEGKQSGSQFARAFLTTSLLYCIGPLAIMGPIQEGLTGQFKILALKAALDGIASVVFASTMGLGVLFSAGPVLVVQGTIAIGAGLFQQLATTPIINETSAVGGAILVLLGLKILEIKSTRVANLLPAILIAPLVVALLAKLGIPAGF